MGWHDIRAGFLMIGVSKTQVTGSEVDGSYRVNVNPSIISTNTGNGSYTSPLLSATVYNGVGPYTYDWRSPDVSFSDPTSRQTTFRVSGYSETVGGAVVCVVTDTGSAGAEVFDNCLLDITFS